MTGHALRRAAGTLSVLLTALLGGCIPLSLNPIYEPKETVFEPALLGTWVEESKPEEKDWVFRICRSTGDAYAVAVHDDPGPVSNLEAHMTKLGGALILDVIPADGGNLGLGPTSLMHLIGGHSLYQVKIGSDTFRYGVLDNDWLKSGFKEKKFELSHAMRPAPNPADDLVLITAPTAEARKFLADHAGDPGAFSYSEESLRRIGPCPPPK